MFEQFIGTKPVEERHRIDIGALQGFLQFKISRIEQFKGGQSNPTYKITAADGKAYALRRKPPGKLLPSAHAVDREFKVISALHPTGFPVAKPLVLCEDGSGDNFLRGMNRGGQIFDLTGHSHDGWHIHALVRLRFGLS